jgi:hypothetical protein
MGSNSCICETKGWVQYIVNNISSLLILIIVGGSGVGAFKFRDTLKKLLCGNVIAQKIFPAVAKEIELEEVKVKSEANVKAMDDGTVSPESLAADYIMRRNDRKSIDLTKAKDNI